MSAIFFLRFVVQARHVNAALDHFDGENQTCLSATAFEHDGDGREDADHWIIEALFDHQIKPDQTPLQAWQARQIETGILPDADWLAEVAKSIEPCSIGPFFIHARKDQDQKPPNAIGIEIEAGLAFGSGEHPTTKACLQAMLNLGQTFEPETVLDMGCGSAVLAIAAAKLYPTSQVTGIEIDPRAAKTAQDNVAKNRTHDQTQITADDGYQATLVARNKPFDLILANILADAVSAMAKDAKACLAHDGRLIVSGLLARQAGDVTKAHTTHGLRLIDRIDHDGWSALVFAR